MQISYDFALFFAALTAYASTVSLEVKSKKNANIDDFALFFAALTAYASTASLEVKSKKNANIV
ncbi:MAG: hypothetical protein E7074_02050 [Bacteroidales bacterium]|nr:hypothetical protein [Bacteroidales bacterium]